MEGIKATLKKILDNSQYHCQIPAILASLRAAGVSLFSMEITELFGKTPLVYYLTTISVPLVDDDDDIVNEPFFQTYAKHFGHVIREAERILGPHELSTPLLEKACVVPFSSIQQFLESHIIEEKS